MALILNPKIMLVDDERLVRQTAKAFLYKLGFDNIIEANDGMVAWLRLKQEKVDLIIADWDMPTLDGLEFLKKIRSDEKLKKVPFLILTAHGEKDRVIQAVQAGATNYIVKPVTRKVLKEKIKPLLRSD
ncbi:MAG: response regulator [Nitrospinales bacterium]